MRTAVLETEQARAAERRDEARVIAAMLDAWDAMLEAPQAEAKRARADFKDQLVEGQALYLRMRPMSERRWVGAFLQLAGVVTDLISTTEVERAMAAVTCEGLAYAIREQRGLRRR